MLRPLLDCIERLAYRRRNELSRVQEALETVVANNASPEEILRRAEEAKAKAQAALQKQTNHSTI